MNLLPTEEVIETINSDKLILTNLRLQYQNSELGSGHKNIIFLEDISSVEIRFISQPLLLIVGLLVILYGIAEASGSIGGSGFGMQAIIIGVVILIIYLATRKHVVCIKPNGGSSINFEKGKMQNEEIEDFIDKLQLAKLNRRPV